MSKKKTFTGNTMTLKDFHGGSIPSDLPLPSAPGVTARPSERSAFERPSPWGNPVGRPDHRARPNSSPATRHLDDQTPFLSQTMPIGRNFDEDERKPLDGVSVPRRTVSDDSIRVASTRLELKPQSSSGLRPLSQQGQSQVMQLPSQPQSIHPAVAAENAHLSVNLQLAGGNTRSGVPGSFPNAWATRKEAASFIEPTQSSWTASTSASKLVHASALDKVSSGRWQSKQSVQYHVDVDINRSAEGQGELIQKGFDEGKFRRSIVEGGGDCQDAALSRHVERNLNISEGLHGGRKEFHNYMVVEDLVPSEGKESNSSIYTEPVKLMLSDGKFGQSRSQQPVPSETPERPKLKLLPRTKPLESSELPIVEHKERRIDPGHSGVGEELHGSTNMMKHASHGMESGNQTVERPKLNLKPRSQPLEHIEGNTEHDRSSVFGGARPRELVLRERRIDDVSPTDHDLGQGADRFKPTIPKTERVPGNVLSTHHIEQAENVSDQRNGKKFERKDQRTDERGDLHRRNWRNDNRRNGRDTERLQPHHHQQQQQQQQQQQPQERRPSPETWRKPADDLPRPSSVEGSLRFGKAASAVELAQAFSGSFSSPATSHRLSGQKGLPAQPQMPFSRLTGSASRAQINGY